MKVLSKSAALLKTRPLSFTILQGTSFEPVVLSDLPPHSYLFFLRFIHLSIHLFIHRLYQFQRLSLRFTSVSIVSFFLLFSAHSSTHLLIFFIHLFIHSISYSSASYTSFAYKFAFRVYPIFLFFFYFSCYSERVCTSLFMIFTNIIFISRDSLSCVQNL